MVSKAAERSRRVRREIWPESVFNSRLLSMWRRAVSVLWCLRYADWYGCRRLWVVRWSLSCSRMTFSSSLERNDKLETGL